MPRRRRRISIGGVGTLLVDERAQRAKVEQESRQKAAERSRNYVRLVNNYVKDGTATYEETEAALRAALVTEDSDELKGILQDYLDDIKLTKQTKDVNNLIDDYTYGRKTYEQFTSALRGVNTSNALIQEAVSKSLQAARKTENNRLMNKWNADYASGDLPFEQYVQNLNGLRNAPDQHDPNDIAAITLSIEKARENEQQIEDNKQYINWQMSGNSAEALAYFQRRLVNARNAKDANTVEAYMKAIQMEDQKQAKAASAAWAAAANSATKAAYSNARDILKQAVSQAASPEEVMDAYEAFSGYLVGNDKYPGLLNSGAPVTSEYRIELETLNQEAMLEASKVASKAAEARIKELEQTLSIPGLDEQGKVGVWTEIAKAAREAMNSEWIVVGKEKFASMVEKAATAVASIARTAQTSRSETQTQIEAGLSDLYGTAKTLAGAGAYKNVPEEALASEDAFRQWVTKGRNLPRLIDDLSRFNASVSTGLGQRPDGSFGGTPVRGQPTLNVSEKISSGDFDKLPDLIKAQTKADESAVRALRAFGSIAGTEISEWDARTQLGLPQIGERGPRGRGPLAIGQERALGMLEETGATRLPPSQETLAAVPEFLSAGEMTLPEVRVPVPTPSRGVIQPVQFSETATYLMSTTGFRPHPRNPFMREFRTEPAAAAPGLAPRDGVSGDALAE